jgi:mono/diheme cytochrome c family protein
MLRAEESALAILCLTFMRRSHLIIIAIVVLLLAAGIAFALQFNLSALPEPGIFESRAATRVRHFLVAHANRDRIPVEPLPSEQSIAEGDKLYGAECAMCHGLDGAHATDTGRWMYPRAANLRSAEIQSYSNRELFWIIKNGIRLSGMPAFGKLETDDHIWSLVHYLRTLGSTGMTEMPVNSVRPTVVPTMPLSAWESFPRSPEDPPR